jgi:hypothetical protein
MEEKKDTYTFVDKRGQGDAASTADATAGQPEKKPEPEIKAEPEKHGTRHPQGEVPPIDFSTLIMSLATSAVMAMGKAPDPHTGQVFKDMVMAKQNIDIIAMLQGKTKGNCTKEEEHLLEGILYELRMLYVEAQEGKP